MPRSAPTTWAGGAALGSMGEMPVTASLDCAGPVAVASHSANVVDRIAFDMVFGNMAFLLLHALHAGPEASKSADDGSITKVESTY